MSNERSTVVTYAGLNLLAKGNTGVPILFTKVLMGDGRVSAEQDIRQLTSMINPLLNLPIQDISVTGVGTTSMDTLINNKALAQGFFAREIGVFACEGVVKDGEIVPAGDEILYSYRNTGDKSDYVPAGGGPEVWDLIYNVTTVIDQADEVTAVIDGSAAYVNKLDFIKHKESDNPHPNLVKNGEEVSTAGTIVCDLSEANKKLNYISIDNLKRQMLGDISDIPLLNSRVRQLERENAALALKMEAENMMPDCNMLLAENFNFSTGSIMENDSDINMTKITVLSAVAGDNSIDVNSVANVKLGDYLWITDGLKSEYVQVKACIKNSSIYRVLVENNLVNTYDLDNTYMYYTTSFIDNGTAYGSADVIGQKYMPKTLWKGLVGNQQYIVNLDTSQEASDNFDISGMEVFTDNGLLSINNGGAD